MKRFRKTSFMMIAAILCIVALGSCKTTEKNAKNPSINENVSSLLNGTWEYVGEKKTFYTESSGTITFSADLTGQVIVKLGNKDIHNTTFDWNLIAVPGKNYSLLQIKNAKDNLNGKYKIMDVTEESFVMNDNFAFGMPKKTIWKKK